VVQQGVLWAWHTPRALAASLESDPVHIAMHASLLAAGLLFWTAILRPRQGGYWGGVLALLVTLKVMGIVSILFLLSPNALYAAYGDSAAAWGLTPLEDEQLGWGVMMTVGMLTYLGAAVVLSAVSLARLEGGAPAPGTTLAKREG
jgi:putative membrane protein